MVDTKRTLAELQTLLPDNTSGDISPQDLRDMLVSTYPAWTSFTPTWTNFTIGNGTQANRYMQLGTGAGSLVIVSIAVVLGSTSSVSGAILGTLPVTAKALSLGAAEQPLGSAQMTDPGSGFYGALVSLQSTTQFQMRYGNADSETAARVKWSATSSTLPFTWGTGDSFGALFTYEAG